MNANHFENSRVADGTLRTGAGHAGSPEANRIDPKIGHYLAELKSQIPADHYGALESRTQALLNDPDTSPEDVIAALRREFAGDPAS